jgi:dihydroflavonol-4-reductase
MKKVLVTGVSGFLGSHIAIEGIRRGYSIRGTVRTPEKISGVRAIFEKQKSEIVPEIFLADLLQEEGWIKATHGCDAVMHVASPFLLELPKHEDELIRPAVEGVRNVLAACLRNQVNRIVQTSSVAAIVFGHEAERSNFDETDWTNPDGKNVSPYYKSKFLAEKEFWRIGQMNPELQLTSICPGLVFGPLLNQDTGTSVEILHRMLKGKYPGVPRLGFPCVDVRDVAKLHWDALENPASIGLRLPAVSDSLWFYEIAEILKQCFPAYSSKVSTRVLPDWFVRIYAIFEKSVKMILPELGFCPELSIGVSQKFHFKPRPVKDSIHDSAKSIIELGLL